MSKNLVVEYRTLADMIDSKRMQAENLRIRTTRKTVDQLDREIAMASRAKRPGGRAAGWK